MIKFRAWDREANIMIYSDHRTRKLYDVYYGFEMNEKGELECCWEGDFTESHVLDGGTLDNIMQSTGLKDKNGVEIYEGDVVKLTEKTINGGIDTHTCKVFQSKSGSWRLGGRPDFSREYTTMRELYSVRSRTEVIGNIYENPELMEVQE